MRKVWHRVVVLIEMYVCLNAPIRMVVGMAAGWNGVGMYEWTATNLTGIARNVQREHRAARGGIMGLEYPKMKGCFRAVMDDKEESGPVIVSLRPIHLSSRPRGFVLWNHLILEILESIVECGTNIIVFQVGILRMDG